MKSLSHVLASLVVLSLFWVDPVRGAEAKESPAAPPPPEMDAYLELGPLLGHVSSSDARVWVKASRAAESSVRVGHKADLSDGVEIKGPQLEAGTDFTGQVVLPKLAAARSYFYSVWLDGKPALLPPYPSFVTAPIEQTPSRVRVGIVSCVGYQGYDSAAAWADLDTRTNIDVLLMVGDNHYANSTDAKVVGRHLGVQRRLPGYAGLSRRVPQYAIWDNHDYGPEPCDKTAKNKERALEIFKNYWPNPAFGEPDQPGCYFKFTRGAVDFFMTDGRYDRDPNDKKEDGTKSLLGAKQLAWLKRELLASQATVKLIASGGEFQTHGQKNSWTSFLRERDDLFQFIEDNKISGVLLASGDRHFTAAYQAGGKFIEISSGPMGSVNSGARPTPEMFYYGGKGKFYCVFEVDTREATPKVTLEIYKASEGLVERRAFTWDEVLGVTKIKPLSAATTKEASKP